MAQGGTKGSRHARIITLDAVAVVPRRHQPIDPVSVSMELVVAEFEGHIQVNHYAGQNSESESKDVDACSEFMPAETAQGKKQLSYYHNKEYMLMGNQKEATFITG